MRVVIGYDPREALAYDVAQRTLHRTSGLQADRLDEDKLRAQGLLWRPVDRRGRMHDLVSSADQATEFAISRFLVPIICSSGWALFTDCDVVFLEDVHALIEDCVPPISSAAAVYVAKHDHEPREQWKMDGQAQLAYPRKNWSSVMLFNCDHPAHRRLNLHTVNSMPGRWLHALSWLHDREIGDLPRAWNWLVGVQPKPADPAIAHFTLGGPWIPGWHGREHDEIWMEACKL